MGIRTDQDDWQEKQRLEQSKQVAAEPKVAGEVCIAGLRVTRIEQATQRPQFLFSIPNDLVSRVCMDEPALSRFLRALAALADLGVGKPDG